jgi:uncharacterized protein (TIGR00369 family)
MFENMKKFESRNPRFREYTEYKIAKNKHMKWLGFEMKTIEAGYMEGELVFKEIHEQQNGWLHGGVSSTILDMVQGFAAYSMVEDGQQVFTVEAKISYYNPGISNKFFSRGYVVKPGKRFHFCEGEIYYLKDDGTEVIVAKGSATMAVV